MLLATQKSSILREFVFFFFLFSLSPFYLRRWLGSCCTMILFVSSSSLSSLLFFPLLSLSPSPCLFLLLFYSITALFFLLLRREIYYGLQRIFGNEICDNIKMYIYMIHTSYGRTRVGLTDFIYIYMRLKKKSNEIEINQRHKLHSY